MPLTPIIDKLSLEVTLRCPNKCLHCSSNSGPASEETVSKADMIARLNAAKIAGIKRVVLTDGEPLTHPDIIDIAKEAKSRALEVIIYTSGSTLIDDKPAVYPKQSLEKLIPFVSRFNVSLHSSEATEHDSFMATEKSWERARAFIQAVVSSGKTKVHIHCVLTKRNAGNLAALAKLAKTLKVDEVRLLNLVPQGRALGIYDSLQLSAHERERVGVFAQAQTGKTKPVIRLGAHIPTDIAPTPSSYHCSLGDKLTIAANGQVSLCPALRGVAKGLDAPNVNDQRELPITPFFTLPS